MDPHRAAEIIVSLPDGARRGSGYLTATGTVLTAAHVVHGATVVQVRFDADRPGERTSKAIVAWLHTGIDVAVLTVDAAEPAAHVGFGKVGERDTVLTVSALGYPHFKLRTDVADGSRYRDLAHLRATCPVLANRREGTLDLNAPPPADGASWEGMSGAVVHAAGRIVGVITHHHTDDGPGHLAASRTDRWAERLTVAERRELEGLLGHTLVPVELPDALAPIGLDRVSDAYRAQLLDIAPPALLGREEELHRLVEFCVGSDPYMWIQGRPWAGKTALAAWFALHPPHGVVPVAFFVTARLAGQADSAAFTESVIHQLAALTGHEPAAQSIPTARDGERRMLLREAAERLALSGGTLLLVVDGLDEDQSTGPSIASLLPEQPPPNMRVLVMSRPSPGTPQDVKGSHPLRHCPVRELSTAEAAHHTEHEAKYDLARALTGGGDDLSRDLVGLVAAARGSLGLPDLAELTKRSQYELRQRLGSAFARILSMRVASGTGYRGYVFAHETLLASTLAEFGDDLAIYEQRLHAWARCYADRGWPSNTPGYLLHAYGPLVELLADTDRLAELATDARRHDRLREATGSDAAALAEIDVAQRLARCGTPSDLGTLTALAAARDLLAHRNRPAPLSLLPALVRLGHPSRAVGLASTVHHPWQRAMALIATACALAEAGDALASDLAREAVRLADSDSSNRGHYDDVRHGAAEVLMMAGEETAAFAQFAKTPWRDHNGRPSEETLPAITTLTRLAAAVHLSDPQRARKLWKEAERRAEVDQDPFRLPRALAAVADAVAMVKPAYADHLYNRVARFGEARRGRPDDEITYQHAPVVAPAAAAIALRDARPQQARRLAELAAQRSKKIRPGPPELAEVVQALAYTGSVDEARRHMSRIGWAPYPPAGLQPGEKYYVDQRQQNMRHALVRGLLREGRWAEALQGLIQLCNPLEGWYEDMTVTTKAVVTALVEADALQALESVRLPVYGLADVADCLAQRHGVDQRIAAMDYLEKVERAITPTGRGTDAWESDPWLMGSPILERIAHETDKRLTHLATALAAAGHLADAERLTEEISDDARAVALCAISLECPATRALDALRLAAQAASGSSSGPVIRSASESVIRALAAAGATEEALDVARSVARRYGGNTRELLAAAMEQWAHDPAAAAKLTDSLSPRSMRDSQAVLPLIGLLAAAPHGHPVQQRLMDKIRHLALGESWGTGPRPQHIHIGMCLLAAKSNPSDARRWLEAASQPTIAGLPAGPSPRSVAIAHAALGDLDAAVRRAETDAVPPNRGLLLAAVAAYLAGVRCNPAITWVQGSLDQAEVCIFQRFALHHAPPGEAADGNGESHRLLAMAVVGDGWYHALPILAKIEPEAVLRVRDVVFTRLGLEKN